MYLIFGTIIVLTIVFFFDTIFSIIKSNVKATTNSTSSKTEIGNMWFVSLIIINLVLIIFTCAFYYYKSQTNGEVGPPGDKGNKGYEGDYCVIKNKDTYT